MTLRLVMPILVTVFMLVFVGLFSEFLLASIFLRDVDTQTLGVGLYGMTHRQRREHALRAVRGRRAARVVRRSCCSTSAFQRQLVGGLTRDR